MNRKTEWTEKKERENGFQAKIFFFLNLYFLFPFNQKIIRAKDINIKPN